MLLLGAVSYSAMSLITAFELIDNLKDEIDDSVAIPVIWIASLIWPLMYVAGVVAAIYEHLNGSE